MDFEIYENYFHRNVFFNLIKIKDSQIPLEDFMGSLGHHRLRERYN